MRSPSPLSPSLLGAAVALSVTAAYAVAVALSGLPLSPPQLWDALSRGSFLAHPPLRFLVSCAPPFALSLVLS
ncbi:MAG: hypothetical protein IPF99_39110 [Deltaproteobacteria bacterium]|nr:hypothetical protein [Deltaproteobacteria bacterium]